MTETTAILIIASVSKELFGFILTQENSKNCYCFWLRVNSNSDVQNKRFILPSCICLPVLPNKPVAFFPPCCFPHVRGALCKRLRASSFRAPSESSWVRKAAKTWQGGGGWFSISIASPAEKYVLPGFGAPFVFSASTCFLLYELSWGKKLSFFFFVAFTVLFDSRDSQLPIPWL